VQKTYNIEVVLLLMKERWITDGILAMSLILLAVGVYLPWATDDKGTLGLVSTISIPGFFLPRIVILVPLIAAIAFRYLSDHQWAIVLSLGIAAFSTIVVPAFRLSAANEGRLLFAPGVGLYLTNASGILIAFATGMQLLIAFQAEWAV